jgi:hypothetical protein
MKVVYIRKAAFDTNTTYSEERTHLLCLIVPIAKSSIPVPDSAYSIAIADNITGSSSEADVSLTERKKSVAFSIKSNPSAQPTNRIFCLLECADAG